MRKNDSAIKCGQKFIYVHDHECWEKGTKLIILLYRNREAKSALAFEV